MSAAAAAGRIMRTASAIISRPSRSSHMLRVDGYSHLVGVIKNGEHVNSCVFDAGGHDWRLLLYPNGSNESCSTHIGVFLQLAGGYPSHGDDGRVRARPRFSLVDSAGKPAQSRDLGVYDFSRGHDWGVTDFIAREELERSEYLRDDCFAIQCEVDVTAVWTCHDHPVFISQNISVNLVSDAT